MGLELGWSRPFGVYTFVAFRNESSFALESSLCAVRFKVAFHRNHGKLQK